VRVATRLRMTGGDLKLCGVSRRLDQVLTITKLNSVFESYASPAEALAAFSKGSASAAAHERIQADVLCVHRSTDVLSFVRTLLKQAGYGVITADNLVHALALLQSTPARAILIEGELRAMNATSSASRFNRLIERLPVVEVPADFPALDPGVAAQQLLAGIGTVLRGKSAAAANVSGSA